jgi:hypothetical protein
MAPRQAIGACTTCPNAIRLPGGLASLAAVRKMVAKS